MKRGAFFDRARKVWVCVLRFLAGNTFSLLQISILRPDLSNLQKAKNHPKQPEIKFSLNRMFSFIPQSFLFLILIFFTIKTENGKKKNQQNFSLKSKRDVLFLLHLFFFSLSAENSVICTFFLYFLPALQQQPDLQRTL